MGSDIPQFQRAPDKGFGRRATYKTFRKGENFVTDTYVDGRFTERLVIRAIRNKKTGKRRLERELFTMKPGLPKIYHDAFRAGLTNRMMRVAGGKQFYSHFTPDLHQGATEKEFRVKHPVSKDIPARYSVLRAVKRGSWRGRYLRDYGK